MIAVTGGAGFIGTHLVSMLVNQGNQVRVIEHPQKNTDHLPLDAIEIVRCDITNRSQTFEAIKECNHVYHLAANPNLWTKDRNDFDRVNFQGSKNVIDAAIDTQAERILHTSTESILTSKTFSGGAVENLELNENDMVGPYCLSKFRAEQYAMNLSKQHHPVLVVNPTLPIGPMDYGLSPPTRMTLQCLKGKLPAYLNCRFNMIDVRDIAQGMISAMEFGEFGKRYLLGAHNIRLIEWLGMVANAIGRKPPRIQVPYSFALLIAYLSEWYADWISHKQPDATITGVRLTRYCMHFDPTKSLQELQIQPRPLEESLQDAIDWYRTVGWIT